MKRRLATSQQHLAQDEMRHDAAPVGINLKEASDAQPPHFPGVTSHVLDGLAERAQHFVVLCLGVGLQEGEVWRMLEV